ncbi:hypothetical protein, partial [Shewanella sp.]|uniref:hypothetical protein n=1 Tax=Shewanella sp. TaxID=50422 RepID=UPI0040542D8B
ICSELGHWAIFNLTYVNPVKLCLPQKKHSLKRLLESSIFTTHLLSRVHKTIKKMTLASLSVSLKLA